MTRGLWLVVLNFTVVWYLGWSWQLDLQFIEAGIINAIGVSMIVLAVLIWLPRWAIAAVALGQVFGHNLLVAKCLAAVPRLTIAEPQPSGQTRNLPPEL